MLHKKARQPPPHRLRPLLKLITPPVEGAPQDALLMNIGMVWLFLVLFYLLLIRPQQKRFKDHAAMINKMDKGTKVVTQGGLVGVIEKVVSDNEVIVDFGNNVKMTMMRSLYYWTVRRCYLCTCQ